MTDQSIVSQAISELREEQARPKKKRKPWKEGRKPHPNSIKPLNNQSQVNKEMAQDRQQAFLDLLASYVEKDTYPVMWSLCKALSVPYATFSAWKRLDEAFKVKYQSLMDYFNDRVEKSLIDASKEKWGVAYAISWLKANRPEKWGDRMQHSGNIGTIQLITGMRRPENEHGIPTAQNVETESESKANLSEATFQDINPAK